jgi:hypothetical protein
MFQESTSQPEWSCMRLPAAAATRVREMRGRRTCASQKISLHLDQERGALDWVEFLLGAL